MARATDDDAISISAAASLFGVDPSTLRRWEKDGRLAALGVEIARLPSGGRGGHRRYSRANVLAAKDRLRG